MEEHIGWGRGDFEVIKWGASHKGTGPFLWGKLTLRKPCKDFDLAIVGGLDWMKWLKMEQENVYIHAIIHALYPFW